MDPLLQSILNPSQNKCTLNWIDSFEPRNNIPKKFQLTVIVEKFSIYLNYEFAMEEEGNAEIIIPFPKRLIILIPLYMVYYAIKVLIDLAPWILDVLKRGSFIESAILIGMAGGTILPAFFAVLFGFLWARKIIRGEDTSQL